MARASNTSQGRRERGVREIFGVPERFMRPRLVLIAVTLVLVCFGLLMIYSASSVTSLTSSSLGNDPAYYVKRQLKGIAIGVVLAVALARLDYRVLTKHLLRYVWLATVILLLLIFTPFAGSDAYGASRWISIAGFTLQPSEFAKITIILTAANLAARYFEDRSIDFNHFVGLLVLGVGLPLGLILLQPDKGSTIIACVTLLIMAYLAGIDRRIFIGLAVLGIAAALYLSFGDSYSRARIMTMLDPWADYYGAGYQLIQGFYAFGSGGLFGVGLGFSRQKYSYLPMAYNDFIFAVIGEELGYVGTLGTLVGFAIFAWAGFRIAKYAPDMTGQLIAAGCTSLIIFQMLVNICGVIGIMPLTGKPIPFVSYGGTTIMSCLMLVGLIVSVSRRSVLPETVYDDNRRSWQMTDDGGASLVGTPMPRSARRGQGDAAPPRGSFRVMDGGSSQGRERLSPSSRQPGRVTTDSSGRRRIDLGPSAAERLRGSGGSRRSSDRGNRHD